MIYTMDLAVVNFSLFHCLHSEVSEQSMVQQRACGKGRELATPHVVADLVSGKQAKVTRRAVRSTPRSLWRACEHQMAHIGSASALLYVFYYLITRGPLH